MSQALLIVSLGPVQEFIAQARRTRDLWFGSHLLSELSKAAARALAQAGELVFPALEADDARLAPQEEPLAAFNVANKIVALVPEEQAEQAARRARDAAGQLLHAWAARVRTRCVGLLANTLALDAAWDEQIATFLDFQAVWVPCAPQPGGYRAARQRAEAALAARKALRDFEPWRAQRGGVPKSSLDGGRETVLRPPEERDVTRGQWRQYRIAEREQLDALGLLKRAGGKPDQFIPIANVAAATWLRTRSGEERAALERLASTCQQRGLLRIDRDLDWVRVFPYDIEVLRPERAAALIQEHALPPDWLTTHVDPVLRRAPQPPSYVACLVADGDRMGQTLEALAEPEPQRALSRALAAFAQQARTLVEREHDGLLIYAGGDDVLAFVSVERALACADALRLAFLACVQAALPAGVASPTLSVGLGLGHVLENMGDLLAEGRQAERDAKGCRNALAVRVMKRAGATVTWRSTWDRDPRRTLGDAQQRFGERRLSRGKVHEVRGLLRRLAVDWMGNAGDRGLLARHTWGIVRRSEAGRESLVTPASMGFTFDPYALTQDADVWEQVDEWSARHLVAAALEPRA
jgi:CRISPR-associated protein Cmr2